MDSFPRIPKAPHLSLPLLAIASIYTSSIQFRQSFPLLTRVLPRTFFNMASDEKGAAADMAKGSNEGSDTESLRGPIIDPVTGERKLVRQLKNRHIAMIR